MWAAAKQNDYEMVKLLLDRGADLTLANAVICSSYYFTEQPQYVVRLCFPIEFSILIRG